MFEARERDQVKLIRVDPGLNIHRWYTVIVQPTLFLEHAVVCGWGRRGSAYARWKIIPTENQDQAKKMAQEIVTKKIKRGYECIRPN